MRRNIALWALYDFANSVTEVVFYLYFSQWLVIDRGVPDVWFNAIFIASTLLLLASAPAIALISDRMGRRLPFLRVTTVVMFACFAGSATIAAGWPEWTLLAALLFLGANYTYQFSFVFYNPMLEELGTPAQRGRISGLGQAANWIGQIAGLLVTLPLADGAFALFGEPGRAQTLLPATIFGAILAIPMLLWFREVPPAVIPPPAPAFGKAWKESVRSLLPMLRVPGVAAFLLGYFLFSDAIITATDNFPIFLEQVWHVNDDVKSMLLVFILVTSAIGSLLCGWLADKWGLRKTLLWMIGFWVICLPVIGFARPFWFFVLSTVAMGLLFGAVYTVTRAVMVTLLPREQLNYGMTFYTLAERFSTLFGPLAWGLIVTGLQPIGPLRYRLAMTMMAVFVLFGTIVIARIPRKSLR